LEYWATHRYKFNSSDVYQLRCVKHIQQVNVTPLELLSPRHTIESHQLFDGGHLAVAIHACNRQHAIVLHVESEEVLRRDLTVEK
jgi:hypothetical protein